MNITTLTSAQTKTSPDITAPDSDNDVLVLERRAPDRIVSFLGLDFVPLTPKTLYDRVVQAADKKDAFGYLVTPNVDQMVRLDAHPLNRHLHNEAWANVNDSRILERLASWSGLSLPACPGSDLTEQILANAVTSDEPLVIIGCSHNVIASIKTRYNLTNVRWHEPPMGLKSNPEAIEAAVKFCIANPARFTFICVGSPQQEMVAHAIKVSQQATGIGLCVGASFEFLAGTRQRAPNWMQKLSLEWLFRLLSEPRVLWRRYLVEGPKIFNIWRRWKADT